MAKRTDFPAATAILALADARGQLRLRVTPNAGADAIALPTEPDGALSVRVTATPEDGKANAAVLKLLAKALGRAPSSLVLVRGETGRDKVVRVTDAR
jgi:uncharacterized protein (TIGR00251 family)